MRAMSFMLTTEQMRNRTKTVTRRLGWNSLKRGDRLIAAVKCQGLGKGGKRQDICVVEVVAATVEVLLEITKEDVVREGFPEMSPADFIAMFCKHMKCDQTTLVNRIEFKFVEPA